METYLIEDSTGWFSVARNWTPQYIDNYASRLASDENVIVTVYKSDGSFYARFG